MSHEEALNLILANACPSSETDGVKTISLDLHCAIAVVRCRLIGERMVANTKDNPYEYEIISVGIQS